MTKKFFIPKDKNLLDPKVDSTFKSLFTHEGKGSKIALKSLVAAIIGHKPDTVEVINNELPKELIYAKDIRLDIQCKMPDGSRINVEMQTCLSNDSLRNRALYYGCRMMGAAWRCREDPTAHCRKYTMSCSQTSGCLTRRRNT